MEYIMNRISLIIKILPLLLISGCVVQFLPEISDKEELLVVQGLITDQPGTNTIKLSKSTPLWNKETLRNLNGCLVWITDNEGNSDTLKETLKTGVYITDQLKFRGQIGRTYTLHVKTNSSFGHLHYESLPMKMNPVPQIDSIYYSKENFDIGLMTVEGCRIFFDTHDPNNHCKFYRWNYSETWEFHLPYNVPNRICWRSSDSREIFIKNAAILSENRVNGFPLLTISDPVDRLSIKYSLLVNQYSLNEDEYIYWERFKNMIEQTGGLYDIIPAPVPNNIFCVEDPSEMTLGYFSVSARSSKRIFIEDKFKGIDTQYYSCVDDSISVPGEIAGLNSSVWLLGTRGSVRYLTHQITCADCRSKGTTVKPSFWDDDK
jgi:hypothetical protein